MMLEPKVVYINRLYDQMLIGLYRAMRKGNFLLVGKQGDGKTSALRKFSDWLIYRGAEFSWIPGRSNREFVPPFAKVNLIDDLDALESSGLVDKINKSQRLMLNVISCLDTSLPKLRSIIPVDDIIEIRSWTSGNTEEFLSEWQMANGISGSIAKSQAALKSVLQKKDVSPRDLNGLLNILGEKSITILKK